MWAANPAMLFLHVDEAPVRLHVLSHAGMNQLAWAIAWADILYVSVTGWYTQLGVILSAFPSCIWIGSS